MPAYIAATHQIANMSAPDQLLAYATRLEGMAQSAELSRLNLDPASVRAVATDIRSTTRNLPARGEPAAHMAASDPNVSAPPWLVKDMQAVGIGVRKMSVADFDADARRVGLSTTQSMTLKTGLNRAGLFAS